MNNEQRRLKNKLKLFEQEGFYQFLEDLTKNYASEDLVKLAKAQKKDYERLVAKEEGKLKQLKIDYA